MKNSLLLLFLVTCFSVHTSFAGFFENIDERAAGRIAARRAAERAAEERIEREAIIREDMEALKAVMTLIGYGIYGTGYAAISTAVLENNQREFLNKLNKQIMWHNLRFEFEKSRNLNEFVQNLEAIFRVINIFSQTRLITHAVSANAPDIPEYSEKIGYELQQFLKLPKVPITIDCFDISHFQSNALVGSCVRFTQGKPEKSKFRHFIIKTLTQQNDYAALQEIVSRRYRNQDLPDLIVIDGGKGQLNAILPLIPSTSEVISLAKREETIFSTRIPEGIQLSLQHECNRLLIALRDYAHHFAIHFHRKKRSKAFKG